MVKSLKTITIFALIVTALITGCAKVRVQKIPTPTQYVEWTDKMQRKADKMKGIRFYLPRPFINVFESFPIRTDIYIADGVVSPEGDFVIIKKVKSESVLNNYMAGLEMGTRIPARDIRLPKMKDVVDLIEAQSGVEKEAIKDAAEEAKITVPTGGSPSQTQSAIAQGATGFNSKQVTNDNAAFAFQPLRGNFDIVYLPDFEEQYSVYSFAGLGNAQFALNLGQGWSLQGFNSLTDNSELNKRMYDLIDTSIQAAKTAASAYLGIPPIPTSPGITSLIKPQSGREMKTDEKGSTPGTAVSLKIVVVHYAAKGLYPIIKPRELQERLVRIEEGSGAFNFVLDLFRSFPSFLGISDYDSNAIRRSQQAVQNETGKFTVPHYPYQYISFNTFRYMAIEVIKTDTEPFGTLYDKTGTTGDPGDRRNTDKSGKNIIAPTTANDNGPEPNDGQIVDAEKLESHFNELLFNEKPQSAKVRNDEKSKKIIVRIEHHDNAPETYTKADKTKLRNVIIENLEKKVNKSDIHEKPVELPPSQERLTDLKDSLNPSLVIDSSKKWEIVSIEVEANNKHICNYKEIGSLTPQESQMNEGKVKTGFNNFMKEDNAGNREIELNKL